MKLLGINKIVEDLKGWEKIDYAWATIAISTMIALSIHWEDSPLGIFSALVNILCVLLVAKGKISNYFFGLLGVVSYGTLAYQNQYFGDAMLNFGYYMPMQFVGYFMWDKMGNGNEFKFKKMKCKEVIMMIATSIVGVLAYAVILYKLGGNLPVVDATSTVLSVIAMILMAKGYIEQWYLWIVVNMVSIYMWVVVFMQNQDNISTLIMWLIFLINSVFGAIKWRKMIKQAPLKN